MVFQLGDQDLIIHRFVDDPMFVSDPPGPIAGQGMLQRFRFAESLMRRQGRQGSEEDKDKGQVSTFNIRSIPTIHVLTWPSATKRFSNRFSIALTAA